MVNDQDWCSLSAVKSVVNLILRHDAKVKNHKADDDNDIYVSASHKNDFFRIMKTTWR